LRERAGVRVPASSGYTVLFDIYFVAADDESWLWQPERAGARRRPSVACRKRADDSRSADRVADSLSPVAHHL
jgi:hypothetical protein